MNRLVLLQNTRLLEIHAMNPATIAYLRSAFTRAERLPKQQEHFRKHGAEFSDLGVASANQLDALFLAHIQRRDLRYFSYISTQESHYRHWVLMGMDNAVVVLYNETEAVHWSIMRQPGLVENAHGWWVEIIQWNPLHLEKW